MNKTIHTILKAPLLPINKHVVFKLFINEALVLNFKFPKIAYLVKK